MKAIFQPRHPLDFLKKISRGNRIVLHNTDRFPRVTVSLPLPKIEGVNGDVHRIYDTVGVYNITSNTLASIQLPSAVHTFWLRDIWYDTYYIFRNPKDVVDTLGHHNLRIKGEPVTYLGIEGFELDHSMFYFWQNKSQRSYCMVDLSSYRHIQFAINQSPIVDFSGRTRTLTLMKYIT